MSQKWLIWACYGIFSLLRTLGDFYAYFLVETILSSSLEKFCLKGALIYLCMGKNCEWELEEAFYCDLTVISSPYLCEYFLFHHTCFFFRKYLFLSQEFPELESMPRFQLNCIIPTYFLCIFCFFFSYRMSSFKENNLCNLCTIVTSWLGCTDIVESHYHNAQWFSFTIAKGYHVFFRGFNNWLVRTGLPVTISLIFWEIQAFNTIIPPKNSILYDSWDQL